MIGRRGFIAGLVLVACLFHARADEFKLTGPSSGSVAISGIPAPCWLATFGVDKNNVVVDWKCVAERAQLYRDGKTREVADAYAHVLQAIRDGEAKSR